MRLIISITLFFSILIVQSQNKVTPIQIGNEYVISSKILDQDRVIQIYTPPAYHEFSNKSFPVLYVLDSQEYFLYGIAYQDMLRFKDKAPPFIVVGIKTDRRLRRTLFYKESEKFSSFLKDELIPYIDTNYRTKKQKERLYFGWEMAAGLGLEILAEFPELFSGYILASPTHATNTRMKALRESNNKELNRLLYVSSADEETWIHKDSAFLAHIKLFKSSHFSLFKDEDHYSTPSKSIKNRSVSFNSSDSSAS